MMKDILEVMNARGTKMRVNMYSTKMDGRCGIGTYTHYATEEQKKLDVIITHIFIEPEKKNPFYYFKKAYELSRNCDIAHIQFAYPFFGKIGPLTGIYLPLFYVYLRVLSHLRLFKIVTTMHEIWDLKNPPKFGIFGSLYIFLLNKFATHFSDVIVVLSETAKNRLLYQSVSENKLHLISHGSNIPKFMDKEACKSKIGFNPEEKIITIFGYIKQSKGHDLLIKASKYLESDVIILIAGDIKSEEDKGYLDYLKKIADEKVRFLGFIREEIIPVILNATDMMVLPYREITQSGILNHALAYQIPTVTSDLPYVAEINEKYSCILLCETNKMRSLVDATNKLFGNIKVQNKLKDACKRYHDDNKFETVARDINEVYSICLER